MKRHHQRSRFAVQSAGVVIAIGALAIFPAILSSVHALSANTQDRGGRTKTTPTPTPKPPDPSRPKSSRPGAGTAIRNQIGADPLNVSPEAPLTWQVLLHVEAPEPNREAVVRQTVAIIETRLGAFGVSKFEVQPQGDRILLNLPDVPDRGRLKKIITAAGGLELVAVRSPSSPSPLLTYKTKKQAAASLGRTVPANRRVLSYAERDEPTVSNQNADASQKLNRWVVVESPAIVDGNELRNASAVPGSTAADDYAIAFSLKPHGAERLGKWTGANINRYLGIVLNNEVKSIAAIKGQIFDHGQITGRFTEQSAVDIAHILNSGALPAPVKIIEEGDKLKKGSQ